jgi:hypothetical protein
MSSPGKRSTKGATQISMLQLRYWSLVIGGMLVGLGGLGIQTRTGLSCLILGLFMLVAVSVLWRNQPL